MILGKIIGKSTTKQFIFRIAGRAKKFQYVQVMHDDYGYVLCQILEIERDKEEIARCQIIGCIKDQRRELPRSPFRQETEVLEAEDSLIQKVLGVGQRNGAFIGKLESRNIPIYLNLNSLLTKHIAIIAKTGAGKSYTAGILIEEILDRKIPLLIIDPHGEYSRIKEPNSKEKNALAEFGLSPKAYPEVTEYGDQNVNTDCRLLHLNDEISPQEMLHILPAKVSQSQKALLYSIIKDLPKVTVNSLTESLSHEEDISALNLLAIFDYIKSLNLFSSDFTPYQELVAPGKCSIINLKGIHPEVQEIIVYKLLRDLFDERKLGNIAPFFTVIEESHNFAPERTFGEAKSSSIIRTIASEGRKFGMGLCVVSQRPARLDKNVLSQCNTQVILKVTNPNDLKSLSSSVENITAETAEEIKNLPIGTALVTGVVDIPLLVKIRPRKSLHGGDTINMLEENDDLVKSLNSYEKKDILPIILPKISKRDVWLMEGDKKIKPVLIPSFLVETTGKRPCSLLVEGINGHVVKNHDAKQTIPMPRMRFSESQQAVFKVIAALRRFNMVKLSEKTQMPILRLKECLDAFEKERLIAKSGSLYSLTETGNVLAAPEEYAFLDKIEHRSISYDSKLKAKLSEDDIRQRLSFLPIGSIKNCYIVYYKTE